MRKDCCAWAFVLAAAGLPAGCQPIFGPHVDPEKAYVDARHALLEAADNRDPQVQTKALEALAATEGASAGAIMAQSLRSGSPPVQFAAAMAIGDTRYAPAKGVLLELARQDNVPPRLMCALIYALHNLGDDTYTKELGRLLYDQDKWVRATAAMIMGRMGEPSAVGRLQTVQGSDPDPVVRLQVVEALARLKDERCEGLLEAFTRSYYIDDRLIAVQAMRHVPTRRSIQVLQRVLNDASEDPIVRMAAAGSLGVLGQRDGYSLALKAANEPMSVLRHVRGARAEIGGEEVANLQTMAILALGDIGAPEAVGMLHPLVTHSDGAVRVSAAKAILQLVPRPSVRPPEAPREVPEPEPEAATQPVTRPALHTAGGKD